MIQIPNNPVRTKSMKIFIPANVTEPVCSLKDENEKYELFILLFLWHLPETYKDFIFAAESLTIITCQYVSFKADHDFVYRISSSKRWSSNKHFTIDIRITVSAAL